MPSTACVETALTLTRRLREDRCCENEQPASADNRNTTEEGLIDMTAFSQRVQLSACALFVVAALHTFRADGQTPKESCNDPRPKNCAGARFLGEDKGCACFVCNPQSKGTRKVVCTQNEADKRALYKIVPAPTTEKSPTQGIEAGR